MERVKLIESFPNFDTTGGIFKVLYTHYSSDFEWLTNYLSLDTEYFGNRSGDKSVSPLINQYIKRNEQAQLQTPKVLTSAQMKSLADILVMKYKITWGKEWELFTLEYGTDYNPIDNYSMKEVETPNLSRKHLASNDFKVTDESSSNTDVTITTSGDAETSTYGFNSAVAVGSGDVANSATQNTSGDAEDNKTKNEHTQTGYTEDTETGTRELTRSGNIGVTTSAQMINQEWELQVINFYEKIYEDVDKLLCLKIFD